MAETPVVKGRGAASNPTGHFERLAFVPEMDDEDDDRVLRPTELYRDTSKTILTFNDSATSSKRAAP